MCIDGQCTPQASCQGCAPTERCVDGECQENPCADLSCGDGGVCIDGACVQDPCEGIECPAGEACTVGIDDQAQCVADWNTPVDPPEGTDVDLDASEGGDEATQGGTDDRDSAFATGGRSDTEDGGTDAQSADVVGGCQQGRDSNAPWIWCFSLLGLYAMRSRKKIILK